MLIGIGIGIPFNTKARRVAVKDGFNRADNAASLGNAETGQLWQVLGGSTWGISGNRAYCAVIGATGIAYVESNNFNEILSTTVTFSVNDGILFRLTDVNNYITARFSSTGLALIKIVGGVATTIGSYAFTPTAGTNYNLKVSLQGASIQVFMNGTLQIGVNEPFNQSATKVGLRAGSAGGYFDDFLVEA